MSSLPSRRRLARRLLLLTAGALLVGGLGIAFVVYPVPLFPHHATIGAFSLFSDRPISSELEAAALAATRGATASELYRDGRRYRVFLANDLGHYVFFSRITHGAPESQALVFTWTGTMIVSATGVRQMRERTGGSPRHSRLEGSLAAALAHEVAHLQVAAEVGHSSVRSMPTWKSEGWADFAANRAAALGDPAYDLVARGRHLLDDGAWAPPLRSYDRRHFRWHVMVEYLATVRGLRFTEITDPAVTEEQTWKELLDWLSSAPRAPGAGRAAG